MNQVIAKQKTNAELAMWLEGLSSGDRIYHTDYPNFRVAAQRLLNTTKPDCIFTLCADDSPTPNTLESSCDGDVLWYMGNPGENTLPKFCWHCGCAVKVKK